MKQRPGQEPGDYDGITNVSDPERNPWYRAQCWCGWRGEFFALSEAAENEWEEHHTVEQHR